MYLLHDFILRQLKLKDCTNVSIGEKCLWELSLSDIRKWSLSMEKVRDIYAINHYRVYNSDFGSEKNEPILSLEHLGEKV
jgi:hypothetical protein